MKVRILHWVALLAIIPGFAQENIFLHRNFWKADPSVAEVEAAIAEGNDVTELNRFMFDGVSYAFIEGVNNTTMKHLLGKKGNEVDKITHDGRTYIFWAAYRDNLEMMQWLVDRGAKANIEDAHGYSVQNFAAVTGQVDPKLYDFLLEHGANINATNHSGANALLLVSSFAKDLGIIDYFVSKGLGMDSVDEKGNGIFQYAAKGGNVALLQQLVDKGAEYKTINDEGENAFFMAAQGTRGAQIGKAVFEYLESLGLSPDLVNKNGENLFHLVSSRNDDKAVYAYLMDKGLDINATDNKGRSALSLAVSRNESNVVKFLLDNGADVSTKDKNGNTLAYYLLQTYNAKHPEAFESKWELLDKAGLSLTDAQHDGNSVLHLAAKENNLPLLRRLESSGIDINKKNDEGNTALHLAAMSTANTEILKYLISQGADVSATTDFEETVYDLAKENELLRQQETALEFLKL